MDKRIRAGGMPALKSGFVLLAAACVLPAGAQAPSATPKDFKVAFLGDQGLGPDPEAVLQLVKSEGANLLIHLGDFDYANDPLAWESQTDKVLGPGFPEFSVLGNHDGTKWSGSSGYGALINARMSKQGITDLVGTFGKQCAFHYKGLFFVFTTPGLEGTGHDAFIRKEFAADNSIWRISAWHVDQKLMQVGSKGDEAGWPVYEASREGGAIIATAHEHLYCRTHLLSDMTNRTIASKDSVLAIDKGRTFAFVQGLGGESVRPQVLTGGWWASVYTATQSARPGALFGTFNAKGVPNRAEFYFKDIKGRTADRFTVISKLGPSTRLEQAGRDRYRVVSGKEDRSARVWDLRGKRLAVSRDGTGRAGFKATGPGLVVVGKADGERAGLRVVLP